VLRSSLRVARAAVRESTARKAALAAVVRLPVLLPHRRKLPADVEQAARMLEAGGRYGIAA
jgi:hypothetical protein